MNGRAGAMFFDKHQGASPAGSTGGDSIQDAAIEQFKALIESLQEKLSAVQ